jgi:hypothetical protein
MQEKKFDINIAFYSISEKLPVISILCMKNFITKNDLQITEDEIACLYLRIDKDKDSNLTISEFADAVIPKIPYVSKSPLKR